MLFLFYGRAPSGRAFRFKSSFLRAFLYNHSRIFSFFLSFFFFLIRMQHPKKTLKKSAKLCFVVQSARVIQALLRRALALLPSSPNSLCFLFFRFFFWVCCCFARGLSLLPGGWFRGLFGSFFCLLWWLLLLRLFCLRALFVSFRVRVRLGFVVRVRSFLPLRFGRRWFRSFLPLPPFRVVALLVFVPSLVLPFLRFPFFRLRPSVLVVVRSLLVPLRWCVRWLLALVPFGFRSLVVPALLGWFLPRLPPVVFAVWVRVRGRRLRSPAVWGCLRCCSSLLGFALLLAGVFSRWVRGGFSAPSSL
jgi:hypothetical protein